MTLGGSFKFLGLDWFEINFAENPGMAFGMQFGGDYGKLILSLIRIFVVLALGYIIYKLVQKKASLLQLHASIFIFAGTLGNLLDSIYFGLIFSSSGSYHRPVPATFLPDKGGYAPVLYGNVVDMLHLPIYEGYWPDWIPFFGGKYLVFFQPVFNIADLAINIGMLIIILFYSRFYQEWQQIKPLSD